MKALVPVQQIESVIQIVRGEKILLDADLARLYDVAVRRLNEQLRRNLKKFPADFAFRLSAAEWQALRSQNAILKVGRGQHRKYLPYAFTEHGALQAANILNSSRATAMSVYIIRAFVKMRGDQAANAAILKRLAEIDRTLLTHDSALRDIYQKLLPLLAPPPSTPKREIGFHAAKPC